MDKAKEECKRMIEECNSPYHLRKMYMYVKVVYDHDKAARKKDKADV